MPFRLFPTLPACVLRVARIRETILTRIISPAIGSTILVCFAVVALVAPAQGAEGFDVKASGTEASVGKSIEFVIRRPPGGGVCAVELDYGDGNTKKRRLESNEESATETYTFNKPGHYKVVISGATQFKGLNIAPACPGSDQSLSLLIREGDVAAIDRGTSIASSPEPRNLASAAKERRVALVIGNSAYAQGPLVNPVNDARAMAKQLRSLGFDVVLRENLKARDIGGVYREFRSKIAPGGVALVFYAGHGVQFKGQNYFPAIDADIHSEEDVPLQSLNLGNLLDNMEEAKAGVSLVFLDACRDNPFARRFRSSTRGLAKVEAASGMLIHYATRPGSVASDGEGKNGTYTEALLAQMREPGLPVEQMLKRVANQVVAKTKGKQEPWVEGSLRGDFYFTFQGPTTVNVQKMPADPEGETWAAAENEKSVDGYQAYLDAYPKGQYATAARIKLKGLQKPVTPVAIPALATPAQATVLSTPDDPETAVWSEVKANGAREYLDAYLKQYPKGKYAALAKLELKKLEERDKAQRAKETTEKQQAAERERQEALRSEQVAWDGAKATGSTAAYTSYLERYPTGRYASLAKIEQQNIQRDTVEKDKQRHSREIQGNEYVERGRLAYSGGDFIEALINFRKAAELGDALGQTTLGLMYAEGRGVTKDDGEAVKWYRMAVVQGNALAQASLGLMYAEGRGVTKDDEEAVKLFRMAAEKGNALGQNNLGLMYADGRGGITKDDGEAVKLYRKSAEQGNALGQSNLGYMHSSGRGVTKDDGEAVKWYRMAVAQGNASAQANLGLMYAEGRSVTKDDGEAVKLFRKSAEQGNALGQSNLGYMYSSGRGVTKDIGEAVKWYRMAVAQGNALAQANLGLMYAEGRGVTKDDGEAVKLFRMAAEKGNALGQNNLGYMYQRGRGGLPFDRMEAIRLYRLAASQGFALAVTNLRSLGEN